MVEEKEESSNHVGETARLEDAFSWCCSRLGFGCAVLVRPGSWCHHLEACFSTVRIKCFKPVVPNLCISDTLCSCKVVV